MEEKATLYITFGDYVYGVKIPMKIEGTLDDFFQEIFDDMDVRVHYHGTLEGHTERINFYIECRRY